ncbi:hypothetical protein BDZ89DRAFT_727309 [Hymenopellis radicata]|nr:hypothetical protein BDZ89DRAFT_727309 [Hymenopellis radicata]
METLQLLPFPDMPTDIERLLLETAAWEDDSSAYSLVLVSKLVRQWIDPILYHSVALCTSTQLSLFHYSMILRDDPAFFSRAVKVLCIGNQNSRRHAIADIWPWAQDVLEVCTGVERLAVWLIGRTLELRTFTGNLGRLRPTHMSLIDMTNHGWHGGPDCVQVLPNSLTHLNLDCDSNQDIEDIPWQEIFARCPNLAHISLSGYAPLSRRSLWSSRISIPRRQQIRGLHVFEKEHSFDSEWGSWRGEDTWDLAQKCVATRKIKHDNKRIQVLFLSRCVDLLT